MREIELARQSINEIEIMCIPENFETVVNDLKNAILKDTTIPNMQKFKEGKGVIFERSNNYKRTM